MGDVEEYPRDRADRHARTIARRQKARMQEILVAMMRDGELPDIGFLKLEEMTDRLSSAAVNPAYNVVMKEYEAPGDWIDDDPSERV